MPITYNDLNFNSKLEAQWAVFFDVLDIPYVHTSQITDWGLPGHIPTFFLPDLNVWWEVKRNRPSERMAYWAERIATQLGQVVYISFGDVCNPALAYDPELDEEMFPTHVFFEDGAIDYAYWWCECPKCGKLNIAYLGHGAQNCGTKCCNPAEDYRQTHNTLALLAAYNFAETYDFSRAMSLSLSEEDVDSEL